MKLPNKLRTVLLACAIALQLCVALSLLLYSARVKGDALRNGRVVSLSCRAYDPFSPFKGRYVRLNFDQSQVPGDCLDGESVELAKSGRNKKLYCRMEEGADGLWTVTALRDRLPRDGAVYIEATCLSCSYDYDADEKLLRTVRLDYSFGEYYMQEDYARYVDGIHWDDFNALEPVLSLYVSKDGRCVQQGLTVLDGGTRVSIEDYCRRMLGK
jgi:uncharacterized membrane-anchored protein